MEVKVGSKGDTKEVVLDTGSSMTWMSTYLCGTCKFSSNRFDQSKSSSFRQTTPKVT